MFGAISNVRRALEELKSNLKKFKDSAKGLLSIKLGRFEKANAMLSLPNVRTNFGLHSRNLMLPNTLSRRVASIERDLSIDALIDDL